jgi:hypothetical protein
LSSAISSIFAQFYCVYMLNSAFFAGNMSAIPSKVQSQRGPRFGARPIVKDPP